MSCIFCKILNNEAEASFVYRGDSVSAFMDLSPVNRGHVLVIPNEHQKQFTDLSSNVVGEMFMVAQKILRAIQESDIKCEGANIFLSDGEVAGQEVMHSHLHIAPRFLNDGHRMGFSHSNSEHSGRDQLNEAAKLIAKKI